MTQGYRPIPEAGRARTDMWCHNCSKQFVAELDFSFNGNHIIKCPHCAHEHFRRTKDGMITEDRWNPAYETVTVDASCVWKCKSEPVTSTAAQFLRDRWINFGKESEA